MAKITVPQEKGEIAITVGGGEPLRFKVSDGTVDVPADQVDLFLAQVSGSTIASPATPAKEK